MKLEKDLTKDLALYQWAKSTLKVLYRIRLKLVRVSANYYSLALSCFPYPTSSLPPLAESTHETKTAVYSIRVEPPS